MHQFQINKAMKLLDVLYYFYYKYTIKVLKDNEPLATTVFMLSISESFFCNGMASIIGAKYFGVSISSNKPFLFSVPIIILIINYFYFQKSGRGKEIIIEKPLLFGSRGFSIAVTLIFWIVTFSWLFWGVSAENSLL